MKNTNKSIIAMGGSAGALEVLSEILSNCITKESPPVVVVLHVGENLSGSLPIFVQKHCSVPVKEAEPNEPLQKGHIYFAPPGYHLLISENLECVLDVDEPVLFSRPSIDVLFESVAHACGDQAVGVILSGANSDGAFGLKCLQEKNAQVVVQKPETAMFKEMPQSAISETTNPLILEPSSICSLLNQFSGTRDFQ